jgi:hypothetical protein
MKPRRLYRKITAGSSGSIGFYGCADRGGKLVRCISVGTVKPPDSAKVDCPACGERHMVVPIWRPAVDGDERGKAEVTIGETTEWPVAR